MSEKKRTIMLGFHSPVDGRLLREWLTRSGYEVVKSLDDTADIDLVLMDSVTARRHMDKAFGLKREAKYFLPVLVCINAGENVGRWLKAGFDDVLRLPTTKDEWQARIEIMLRLHRQSEELGQKSEASLIYTLENMSDGFVSLDENWHYIYVNKKAGAMFGRKSEDLLGKHIWTEFPEGIGQPFYKNYYKAVETQKAICFEDYYQPWDRWFENRVVPSEKGLSIFFHDITERKQAEEALRKSEAKFRSYIENAPDGIFIANEKGKYIEVNKAACEITGYSEDELLKLTIPELIQEEYSEKAKNHFQTLVKEGFASGELGFVTKSGEKRFWSIDAVKLSETRFLGFAKDITKRRQAEEALRKSEARLKAAEKLAKLGHWELDLKENVLLWSDEIYRIFELDPSQFDISYEAFLDTVHPDDRELVDSAYTASVINRTSYNIDHRLLLKDGRIKYVHEQCETFYDEQGNAIRSLGTVQDITQRIMAEETRRVLETAIDNAIECIMVSDRENRLTYVNRAFEKLTGYSAAEALGNTPGMLKSGQHDRAFYQNLKKTIYAGHPWQGNLTLRKKNGEFYEAYVTITPICDQAGIPEHFISVHRDVTRERKLEQRIQQNQRIEAIGTLAGGIAHDFNNLLTPIMGYTELCMGTLPSGSTAREDLEKVMGAARRATDLVRQILSFSRRSAHERKPLQMVPIIKEALKLLRSSIPVTIDIRQEITDTAESVIADPTEIHQVVMNLCTNAYHAMPDGGVLTVSLKAIDLDADACAVIPDCTPGRYLNLSVADTGQGIAPEIRDKIFEPYFTTKEEGRGTGLGLAVTHSIVAACGGAITVNSEPGKGTRFSLYFPVIEDTPTEVVEKATITGSGHESILFIDDDAAIVALGKRMLERYGYSVTTSTDPVQALELFKKVPADFDMVISDMTMPGMTGDRLADALLKTRPDLPIIICTGFSERINKDKAEKMGVRRLLTKPVSVGNLLSTIRDIFDGK